MPTPADPGDEPPVEVVVLVDGRAGTVPGKAPLRRRGASRPAPVTGGGPPSSVTGGSPAGDTPDVEFVAPPPPPPPPAPPRTRPPARPRRRLGGVKLSSHVRVPGTIGLVVIVLALALGTGFVGAYVWARNDAHNIRSTPLTPTTLRRTDAPVETEVTTTTKPDLSADAIAEKVGPSVWSVHTFNSAGQPVQGSAWLTRSAGGQSLLITSLAVVEASTHQPAPDIVVSGGGFEGKAQLWTWDDTHDLALLVAGGTAKPALPWVSDPAGVQVGAKVFVVGGDAKLKPGVISAVSDQTVQHNVFVDDNLRGGAVVNVKGEVIAVSSAAYTAGGQPTDTAFFGVPVRLSCAAVLSCSGAFAGPTTDAGAPPSSTATSTTAP